MSYQPNPFTDETPLGRYLLRELEKVSDEFRTNKVDGIEFKVWHTIPDKPRTGQAYYADGTDWTGDGSSGEGLYVYKSDAAWHFLG